MPAPSIHNIGQYIEELAPIHWAESWDNNGLQVGDPGRPAARILVALELTGGVVEEAIQSRSQVIVVHHPPLFHPLKALRFDSASGRRLERCIQAGIGVYAAHTNYDQADGGTNDTLASLVHMLEPQVLKPVGEERYVKLVVYVPIGSETQVADALFAAGAGQTGKYSHCSFRIDGIGTFLPGSDTQPFIGQPGRAESVDEVRLETILPETLIGRVVSAMKAVHPYEEVAYDLLPLANPGRARGHGRIGRLDPHVTLGTLAGRIKEKLGIPFVRIVGDTACKISTVAVGAGSGGDLIPLAAKAGAQLLITGDVSYHDAQDAADRGLCIIDMGHFHSEVIAMPSLAKYLQRRITADGLMATVTVAQAGRDPFAVL
jgi:dinuclear metal center YbgI/SA1388 family protein